MNAWFERAEINLFCKIFAINCRAEIEFAQILSKKNSLLFLDTLTGYYQNILLDDFNDKYQLLLINTGIERKLVNSKYNNRVEECISAYKKLDNNNEVKNF